MAGASVYPSLVSRPHSSWWETRTLFPIVFSQVISIILQRKVKVIIVGAGLSSWLVLLLADVKDLK